MLLLAGILSAQPPFEAASIKPSTTFLRDHRYVIGPGRVDLAPVTMLALITMAYRVETYHVSGSDWMTTERFDVPAKLPDGATHDQMPEMLQALLAARFKLAVHRENKEEAAYIEDGWRTYSGLNCATVFDASARHPSLCQP